MKTIIYSLVAILIFGMVARGFNRGPENNHVILIQATGGTTDAATLSKSADRITARLRSFGTAGFSVKPVGRNRIQVVLKGDQDISTIEKLITRKGEAGFYETLNFKSLTGLLHGESDLLNLLQSGAPQELSARIGCTGSAGINKVNAYLKTAGLDQKCKFAWSSHSGDSDACLYALRLEYGKGILLRGSDIESCTAKQDSVQKYNCIDLRFRPAAVGLWSEITKRNINQCIALVLDDEVIFAPSIRSEINGGNCEITGNFSLPEVRYMAAIIGNGELPVGFELLK